MANKVGRLQTCICLLFFIVLVVGCAPGQLPEEEPIPTSLPPSPVSAAYPSPIIATSVPPIAYPSPAKALSQALPYPEPEFVLAPKLLQTEVVNSYPHSTSVFTQGLMWTNGFLYESGGLRGQSALYQVNLADGQPVQQMAIDETFFAEGIALVDDKIIMLTWQAQTALVFDRETFAEIGRFNYTGQGWGLCYDESNGQLWMSDGSQRIVSRDPTTFEPTGEIFVTLSGAPLTQINELECVDGTIYANLWKSDKIVGISSETGNVELEIDASGMLSDEEKATLQAGRQVLNGIAYNAETGRFYLTGKQWPRLFEVEFK
ncbi:MAG: glutaminyl-peptide cyclotransferase [Anaerolineae bacterium]